MFFVIHGYCGPDNYTSDNEAVLEVTECKTAEEVEKLYTEFAEGTDHEDFSDVTFRIIEGVERKIKPVETATKHKLVRD